jgi:hypothetical protein
MKKIYIFTLLLVLSQSNIFAAADKAPTDLQADQNNYPGGQQIQLQLQPQGGSPRKCSNSTGELDSQKNTRYVALYFELKNLADSPRNPQKKLPKITVSGSSGPDTPRNPAARTPEAETKHKEEKVRLDCDLQGDNPLTPEQQREQKLREEQQEKEAIERARQKEFEKLASGSNFNSTVNEGRNDGVKELNRQEAIARLRNQKIAAERARQIGEDDALAHIAQQNTLHQSYNAKQEVENATREAHRIGQRQLAYDRYMRDNRSFKDTAQDIISRGAEAWATNKVVAGIDLAVDTAKTALYDPYIKSYIQPSAARDDKREKSVLKQATNVTLLMRAQELRAQEDEINEVLIKKLADMQPSDIQGKVLYEELEDISTIGQNKVENIDKLYHTLMEKGDTLTEDETKDIEVKMAALQNLSIPTRKESGLLLEATKNILATDPKKDPKLHQLYCNQFIRHTQNIHGLNERFFSQLGLNPEKQIQDQTAQPEQQSEQVAPVVNTARPYIHNKPQDQPTLPKAASTSVINIPQPEENSASDTAEPSPAEDDPQPEQSEQPETQGQSELLRRAREYFAAPPSFAKCFTGVPANNDSPSQDKGK